MSKKQINEFDIHAGLETPPSHPHVEPTQDFIPQGEEDHEGAMARADLYKMANYAVKLFKKLDDNAQLEGWVQAKITKAADYIASVYHYLEYEMKFSEYGKQLENSDMFNESEKEELKLKLSEAREKIAQLKIAQLQKLEEGKKSPKAKKDWDKDGKIESEKDEVIGSRRKAAGLDESWDDDDEDADVKRADDELRKRKVKLPKTKADPDKDMSKLAKKSKKEDDLDETYGQGIYEGWDDDDDEDPDVKRADSELKKRGVKLPKVKHKEVPVKKTAKDKEEELDEGSGPYQLSDPKHPKFKSNYEKFKKSNPDKKLADFVAAMKKKDKAGLDESWDDDDEDDDVKRADSELKKRGVKLPKVKHKEVPVKKTAKDKEEEKLDEISQKTAVGYVKKVADNAESNKDTFTPKRLKGVITAGNKVMGKPHAKVPATNEGKKPDFLDLDKDGNKKEPMKKAAKEKTSKKECMKESVELDRMKEFLKRLNG